MGGLVPVAERGAAAFDRTRHGGLEGAAALEGCDTDARQNSNLTALSQDSLR